MRPLDFIRSRFLTLALVASCLGLILVVHTLSAAHGVLVRPRGGPGEAADASAPGAGVGGGTVAEGRVMTRPGSQVAVGSEITGRLLHVAVKEGQWVHKGDLLAELDGEETRAEYLAARTKLAEIDADTHLTQWKLQRNRQLTTSGAATLVEIESEERDLIVARSRREAALAELDRINVRLKKSVILSPIDGAVISRFAAPGQVVESGSPIVTVADTRNVWIEAEVNEFDGATVTPGQTAFVTAEGFNGVRWPARVEEVPVVVMTRQLRPQDPGRPTDTGVVLVKLTLSAPAPLILGQRVEVTIQPRQSAGAATPVPAATTAPIDGQKWSGSSRAP